MREIAGCVVKDRQATRERVPEPGLFEAQGFDDERLGAQKLGVGLAHFPRKGWNEPPHQGFLRAKHLGVAHGSPHDPAQHVAAALVRRQDAVRDKESGRAQMVGDDPVARLLGAVRIDAGHRSDSEDQGAHEVDVVIGRNTLQERGDTFKPHAGIDRWPRQIDALVRRDLLELHKDEVPKFEKTVAVRVRAARRTSLEFVALIVENLGARTAWTSIAHGPKIIRGSDTDDLGVRKPSDLLPQLIGFIVVVVNRDEKTIFLQTEFAGQQFPGEFDGERLKIVAEGKIAQHFKKSVVARRITDIVEIIVFAARADAFLCGCRARIGALFEAGKKVLELNHSGVGEHEGWVILRHERRRSHDLVFILFEEIEKGRPDLADAVHFVTPVVSILIAWRARGSVFHAKRQRRA